MFYPSIYHVSRADHNWLLVEMDEFESFPTLVSKTFSYARTRALNVGDQILFRPAMFVFISLEKTLFGFNYMYWQMIGIVLHLCIVGLLFRLLHKIHSSLWAGVFSLGFSVLFISQDMVIWHHINGYLISFIFVLLAMHEFYDGIKLPKNLSQSNLKITMYLLCAAFTYEYSLLCAFGLFGAQIIYSKLNNRKFNVSSSSIILIPIIVYAIVSGVDYGLRFGFFHMGQGVGISWIKLMTEFGQMVGVALMVSFVPGFLQIIPNDRVYAQSLDPAVIMSQYNAKEFLLNVNLALLVAVVVFIGMSVAFWIIHRRDQKTLIKKENVFLIGISVFFALGYILFILAGRTQSRGLQYFEWSMYHFYPVMLFLCVASYCVIFGRSRNFLREWKFGNTLLIFISILAIGLNGYKSYAFNSDMRTKDERQGVFMRELQQFVHEHKNEPDFSFDFAYREIGQPMKFFKDSSVDQTITSAGKFSDYIFRKYQDASLPKYHLVHTLESGLVSFTSQQESFRYVREFLKNKNNNQ